MKLVNAMPLKRAKPDVRETKTGMLKVDAIRARGRKPDAREIEVSQGDHF